ncbi:low-density lipoprotein receptor-related protein 12-like isoform X1 [Branchiostoma floridae x Branchiostoma belcheri]
MHGLKTTFPWSTAECHSILLFIASVACILELTGCFDINAELAPCDADRRPVVTEAQSGVVSSPFYPDVYQEDVTCTWRIVAPPGHHLVLTFDPNFNIETLPNQEGCNFDVLRIYNGPDTSSPLVGEFCGEQAPNPIQVEGNEVLLELYSDPNTAYEGFRVSWSSSCQPGMMTCDTHTCVASEDQCDMDQHCLDWEDELNCNYDVECEEILSDVEQGNLTSMNYPQFYPPGVSCTWIISAPAGQRLAAVFTGIFNVSCDNPVSVLSYRMPNNGTGDQPVIDVADLAAGVLETLGEPCGKSAPTEVFKATAEALAITFNPSAEEAPRAGFALEYFHCPMEAFICSDGTCLTMDMTCDGTRDCPDGEDEGAAMMCPTTEAPERTTTLPNDETTRAMGGSVTATASPGNELTLGPRLTTAQDPTGPAGTNGRTRSPDNSTVTAAWYPTIATAYPPRDTDPGTLPVRRCYSCYGKENCENPWADPDITVPVTECLDDEDCWVERIVGPSRLGNARPDGEVLYRRSCGSKCPAFWHDEACKDGWLQVCSVCCERDLCNRQQLTGEGKPFFNRDVLSGGVAGLSGHRWPSISLVCLALAIFMVSS